MRTLLMALSYVGLALTVVPAFLVFAGSLEWSTHATLMVVGAAVWFVTAPFWMGDDSSPI
jgi:hypothetical protein